MIRILLTYVFVFLFALMSNSQHSYFNIVNNNENGREGYGNVLSLENSFLVAGVHYENTLYHFQLKEFDLDGNLIRSKAYEFPNELIIVGGGNRLQNSPDGLGYYFASIVGAENGSLPILLKFDKELNLEWEKRFELDFLDATITAAEFIGYHFVEDEIFFGGRMKNQNQLYGNFILRTDLEGNTVDFVELPSHNINFIISHITPHESGYILSGIQEETHDYWLLELDGLGNILWEQFGEGQTQNVQSYLFAKTQNNTWIGVRGKFKQFHPDLGNLMQNELEIIEFNPYTKELNVLEDHFAMMKYYVTNIIAVDNNEFILTSYGINESNETSFVSTHTTRINASGELVWNTESYEYDYGFTENRFFGLAKLADGGILNVGIISDDPSLDPYAKSWIVKLDACGDTEWLDCPLVVEEDPIEESLSDTYFYPNPTNEFLNFRNYSGKIITDIEIYDISGKIVLSFYSNRELVESTLDISSLKSGIYYAVCLSDGMRVDVEKISVY